MFGVEGVRFRGFQHSEARQQVVGWNRVVVDAMQGVSNFADIAVRLAPVDLLLISVDTSMAHLAGGMGLMRIFRQPCPGVSAGVVEQVRAALSSGAAAQEGRVVSGAQ